MNENLQRGLDDKLEETLSVALTDIKNEVKAIYREPETTEKIEVGRTLTALEEATIRSEAVALVLKLNTDNNAVVEFDEFAGYVDIMYNFLRNGVSMRPKSNPSSGYWTAPIVYTQGIGTTVSPTAPTSYSASF